MPGELSVDFNFRFSTESSEAELKARTEAIIGRSVSDFFHKMALVDALLDRPNAVILFPPFKKLFGKCSISKQSFRLPVEPPMVAWLLREELSL